MVCAASSKHQAPKRSRLLSAHKGGSRKEASPRGHGCSNGYARACVRETSVQRRGARRGEERRRHEVEQACLLGNALHEDVEPRTLADEHAMHRAVHLHRNLPPPQETPERHQSYHSAPAYELRDTCRQAPTRKPDDTQPPPHRRTSWQCATIAPSTIRQLSTGVKSRSMPRVCERARKGGATRG